MPVPLVSSLMRALHRPVYAERQRRLVEAVLPHLREGDRVLDVGCGVGSLGKAILDHPACPQGVTMRGLESHPRGGEPIEVIAYSGRDIPLEDAAADVVIVADVLHHDADQLALARECSRVAARLLIVKDHRVAGPLAQQRISLIDWAANAPHGVPCLYKYHTPQGWADMRANLGLEPVEERHGMRLYPPLFEQLFGGGLHFLGVWRKPAPATPPSGAAAP